MRLRVTPTSAAAFDWETTAARFRIGRGDGCALRFQGDAGAMVSWEHAEFLLAEGRSYVTDLQSSNGTYVDGVRISAQTLLRIGSRVQLGKTGPRLDVLDLTETLESSVLIRPVASPTGGTRWGPPLSVSITSRAAWIGASLMTVSLRRPRRAVIASGART